MDRVLHAGEGKIIRRLNRIVGQVNSIEEDYVAMSDDELAGQTADFRQRLDIGENLDRLLPEAFATVREASRRVLGKRHFDVQIMGGAALYQCNIAEMKTGEAKPSSVFSPPTSRDCSARASTSSPSTTTWLECSPSRWVVCTTSWV